MSMVQIAVMGNVPSEGRSSCSYAERCGDESKLSDAFWRVDF